MARILVSKILAVAGIALVLLALVNSTVNVETLASPRSVIHDRSFIAAMSKISDLVPTGKVIVVSTNAPFVTYFTGHIARVPFGVSSKALLVQYMKKNQYDYLLVFEGSSQVPELASLFSSKGIKDLEDSYERIQTFRTDFSTIHLFRLRTLASGATSMEPTDNLKSQITSGARRHDSRVCRNIDVAFFAFLAVPVAGYSVYLSQMQERTPWI